MARSAARWVWQSIAARAKFEGEGMVERERACSAGVRVALARWCQRAASLTGIAITVSPKSAAAPTVAGNTRTAETRSPPRARGSRNASGVHLARRRRAQPAGSCRAEAEDAQRTVALELLTQPRCSRHLDDYADSRGQKPMT